MNITDPIADMLTRIRNASSVGHTNVTIPHSKVKESIANILKNEGYVESFKIEEKDNKKNIVVSLKYMDGEEVIKGIKRISKPGRRVYSKAEELPKVLGGLGIAVVSTPKGVVTDKECRKQNVGGEVLCYVW